MNLTVMMITQWADDLKSSRPLLGKTSKKQAKHKHKHSKDSGKDHKLSKSSEGFGVEYRQSVYSSSGKFYENSEKSGLQLPFKSSVVYSEQTLSEHLPKGRLQPLYEVSENSSSTQYMLIANSGIEQDNYSEQSSYIRHGTAHSSMDQPHLVYQEEHLVYQDEEQPHLVYQDEDSTVEKSATDNADYFYDDEITGENNERSFTEIATQPYEKSITHLIPKIAVLGSSDDREEITVTDWGEIVGSDTSDVEYYSMNKDMGKDLRESDISSTDYYQRELMQEKENKDMYEDWREIVGSDTVATGLESESQSTTPKRKKRISKMFSKFFHLKKKSKQTLSPGTFTPGGSSEEITSAITPPSPPTEDTKLNVRGSKYFRLPRITRRFHSKKSSFSNQSSNQMENEFSNTDKESTL